MKKRLAGESVSGKEIRRYQTAFMVAMGREYAKHGMIMQLHYGAQRDVNRQIYKSLGPDTGVDAINTCSSSIEMGKFLNALNEEDLLPKTIIYSLNPADNAAIGTVAGCFQCGPCAGKIQHGAAWWFNDHRAGMRGQMTSLANLGLLGRFIGMLTDSRSFLSWANTAISKATPENFDLEDIFGKEGVRWFHAGGIYAALSENSLETLERAIDIAHQNGTLISYDLNYRSSLWQARGGL